MISRIIRPKRKLLSTGAASSGLAAAAGSLTLRGLRPDLQTRRGSARCSTPARR